MEAVLTLILPIRELIRLQATHRNLKPCNLSHLLLLMVVEEMWLEINTLARGTVVRDDFANVGPVQLAAVANLPEGKVQIFAVEADPVTDTLGKRLLSHRLILAHVFLVGASAEAALQAHAAKGISKAAHELDLLVRLCPLVLVF